MYPSAPAVDAPTPSTVEAMVIDPAADTMIAAEPDSALTVDTASELKTAS
jgi:hypothetical protein